MAEEELDNDTLEAADAADTAVAEGAEPTGNEVEDASAAADDGDAEGKETGKDEGDDVDNDSKGSESVASTGESGNDEKSDGAKKPGESDGEGDDDDLDLPMDEIEALLSTTSTDRKDMTPQMRRVAAREAESKRRVEEAVKNTKANPRWFVPLFCLLLVVGLVWAVVFYMTNKYPIPAIGRWNLLVAFGIMMVGFLMTIAWH